MMKIQATATIDATPDDIGRQLALNHPSDLGAMLNSMFIRLEQQGSLQLGADWAVRHMSLEAINGMKSLIDSFEGKRERPGETADV